MEWLGEPQACPVDGYASWLLALDSRETLCTI